MLKLFFRPNNPIQAACGINVHHAGKDPPNDNSRSVPFLPVHFPDYIWRGSFGLGNLADEAGNWQCVDRSEHGFSR
jgi:hypothetical protein